MAADVSSSGEWVTVIDRLCQIVPEKVCKSAPPGIVFVRHIKTGELIREALQASLSQLPERGVGVVVPFVTGQMSSSRREEVAEQLRRRDPSVPVVVATSAWYTGVDIPAVGWVVLCTGGKAPIGLQQAIGRASRLAEGKTEFEVIDLVEDRWRDTRLGILAGKGVTARVKVARRGAAPWRRGGARRERTPEPQVPMGNPYVAAMGIAMHGRCSLWWWVVLVVLLVFTVRQAWMDG